MFRLYTKLMELGQEGMSLEVSVISTGCYIDI